MAEWRYGRYFLLEDDVISLFHWLNKHIGDNWTVDVIGVCPTEDKLTLSTVFETAEHLKYFEENYIANQSPYGSLYNNRRKPEFKWPVSVERRGTQNRRTDINRRSPKRLESRRLEDAVRRALLKKKAAHSVAAE